MELLPYLANSLDHARGHTLRTVDGLANADMRWRPAPGCNSMGSILLHLGRTEDSYFHTLSGEPTQLWEAGGWHRKLGLELQDRGFGYDSLPESAAPDLKDILAYLDATHRYAVNAVHRVDPARLGAIVQERMKWSGTQLIRQAIHHENHHQGQLDYLRGLREDLKKAGNS